jgi:hypothetical protein
MTGIISCALLVAASLAARAQTGAEAFTATATVKTAGRGGATSPVAITVTRKMSQEEADKFLAAFKAGGADGLRKALAGVAPTGSVRLGDGRPTPTRLTLERTTDKGRLLTMVTDMPIAFLGAGLAGSKPTTGFEFGIIDIEVDAKGSGSGTLTPAAKVTVKDNVFVVQDYSQELVQLTGVTKVK